MGTTILIITVAIALVVGGVGFLLFGVLKLPFSLIGSAVAWLVKPVAKLFGKGGSQSDSASRKPERAPKNGVEEMVAPPMAAAAA